MKDIKKAKAKVSEMKSKKKAAEKRLTAAERNGTDKQIALSGRHVKLWTERYEAAVEDLKELKKNVPSIKERVKKTTFKKVATYSGVSLVVVGLTVLGAWWYDKTNKNGQTEGETATDSV